MAFLLRVDGTATLFAYTGIDSAQRQLGGPFDSVPTDRRKGYLVLVHDEGRLDNLPRNALAEELTGYPEVYGPAVFVSYAEAKEDHLLHQVTVGMKARLDDELAAAVARG